MIRTAAAVLLGARRRSRECNVLRYSSLLRALTD